MNPDEPLLKTHQVALALRVSVSTVKRWVDTGALKATRTVGRHRLIPLSEAIRLAQSLDRPLLGFETQVRTSTSETVSINDEHRDQIIELFQKGAISEAKVKLRAIVRSGVGAVALADSLFRPVMERIGHGWEEGSLDVYQEHEVSQAMTAVLNEAVDRVSREQPGHGPLALGATPEGDFYQLAILLGELVLRELGWQVRNLGQNLPLRSLTKAVEEYSPRLVYLSINFLFDEDHFVQEYSQFFEATAARGVAIMVGGRAFGPDLRARLIYASFGERMAHLSEFAQRLNSAGSPGPKPGH
ncbi:helix-turn-helix domain-containing protein [Singulisphaera rosea]